MWQGAGVLIATMGLAYLLAARDPYRHWPIVLMGLFAKLGTASFAAWGIRVGHFPRSLGWLVVLDDLIWLPLFALILGSAHDAILMQRRSLAPEIVKLALRRQTNKGVSLDELSRLSPVLMVFLRHAGCTFCREALSDLAKTRAEIEAFGARLVLVHMGTDEQGAVFFSKYGLGDVPRISDTQRSLYRAFGLPRGGLSDLFGPKVWVRGFEAGILGRHGVGKLAGDGFQMPGVFLLYAGEVIRSYRHQYASDRPDYVALVTGERYAAPEFRSH
jgi:peroxiredoxin